MSRPVALSDISGPPKLHCDEQKQVSNRHFLNDKSNTTRKRHIEFFGRKQASSYGELRA